MSKLEFNTYWNEKQKQMFKVLLDNENGITDVWYWWWAWWGKSYGWVVWQWMIRNKYPGTRGFFWRKELKRLKQTTLATYFKFLSDYNIPKSQHWNFNAQDSVIRFENGSEILLLDLSYMPSDPLYQRFGSLELTDWFADEIAEIDAQCLMILKTRIWRQKNEEYWLLPKFLWTFNPDKWHVYRDYYKADKDHTMPSYRVFIPALATDNKKLPKSYIEQLKKADIVTQQRLLYGNFEYDDTPWRLFNYTSLLNIFSNPKYNGQRYISADIARKGKDKCVIFVWDWFEIIDYVIFEKSTNDIIELKIKELCQKYGIWMSNVIVDEDWVWWWIVDNLECTWFINNSSPLSPYWARKVDYLKRNYANLKTQCYFELARFVNENKVRFACDSWEIKNKLIEELDIIVQIDLDKDSKTRIIAKEDIKNKLWRSPDFSDAMMFRFYYELLKDPETEWTYTHIKPNDNPYDKVDIDAWERMLKEEEWQKFDEEGWLFDEKIDWDVL